MAGFQLKLCDQYILSQLSLHHLGCPFGNNCTKLHVQISQREINNIVARMTNGFTPVDFELCLNFSSTGSCSTVNCTKFHIIVSPIEVLRARDAFFARFNQLSISLNTINALNNINRISIQREHFTRDIIDDHQGRVLSQQISDMQRQALNRGRMRDYNHLSRMGNRLDYFRP
jgi:hypothetical protein